ncbi:single-stranded DNA-binding protein [Flavobacterium sp. N502540]|uniref:single-stranded DNA-binding protein n=1 Tax=Flavobacterium sp. N502540 TaxID=2986838 RepID=UPI002224465F|nr:single-stranded DNA-binding protein [Flavobacterium sp. N502540]
MEIIGRLTKDAVVAKAGKERQVVNFSIAVNDSYRTKNSTARVRIVTYIECSYWLSTGVAQYLKKGTAVELFGRIGLNVYIGNDSQAHGSLTFHTSNIKIIAFVGDAQKSTNATGAVLEQPSGKEPDDLPF